MRDIYNLIEDLIIINTRYLRTYTGKVVELDDSTDSNKRDKIGRIKCLVYELGWINNDVAPWCYPNDKNSLISPKVDDYVRISFMSGDINRPYYSGIIGELEGMIPDNYTDHNDQVLFESTDKRLYIKYNEKDKEYIREDEDGNKTIINQDGIVEEDINGNKREYTSNGIKWTDANDNEIELTTTGIKWTSAGGKVVELTASQFKMLGATESFVKGDTLSSWLTAFISSLNSFLATKDDGGGTSGSFTPPSNWLSTSIKGE